MPICNAVCIRFHKSVDAPMHISGCFSSYGLCGAISRTINMHYNVPYHSVSEDHDEFD